MIILTLQKTLGYRLSNNTKNIFFEKQIAIVRLFLKSVLSIVFCFVFFVPIISISEASENRVIKAIYLKDSRVISCNNAQIVDDTIIIQKYQSTTIVLPLGLVDIKTTLDNAIIKDTIEKPSISSKDSNNRIDSAITSKGNSESAMDAPAISPSFGGFTLGESVELSRSRCTRLSLKTDFALRNFTLNILIGNYPSQYSRRNIHASMLSGTQGFKFLSGSCNLQGSEAEVDFCYINDKLFYMEFVLRNTTLGKVAAEAFDAKYNKWRGRDLSWYASHDIPKKFSAIWTYKDLETGVLVSPIVHPSKFVSHLGFADKSRFIYYDRGIAEQLFRYQQEILEENMKNEIERGKGLIK